MCNTADDQEWQSRRDKSFEETNRVINYLRLRPELEGVSVTEVMESLKIDRDAAKTGIELWDKLNPGHEILGKGFYCGACRVLVKYDWGAHSSLLSHRWGVVRLASIGRLNVV